MNFPHLAQRLFNVPLAIRPEKAELIVAVLAERLGIASLNGVTVRPLARAPDEEDDWGGASTLRQSLPRTRSGAQGSGGRSLPTIYDLVNGIAVIPICGTLVQKLGGLDPFSGMTGYDQVRAKFAAALTDDEVEAILLDIDSPGGEVAGAFDLADAIFAARGTKPIWAALDEMACSAAYALAAAADRVTIPRTGLAGSIGVVCMHVDWSRALAEAGLAVTCIQYGARKTDGAPEKPLSKEAVADFQAKVDAVGELFVASVARYRGLAPAAVREQEAAVYQGAEAVRVGLADAVMPIDEAFAELGAVAIRTRSSAATRAPYALAAGR